MPHLTSGALVLGLLLAGSAAAQDELELSLDEPAGDDGDGDVEPDVDPDTDDVDDGSDAAPIDTATPDDEAKPEGQTATDEGISLTLQDRIKAVSRKTFLKAGRFELEPGVMVTVNDAFFRSWALSGRVSYHLNDAFSLEVGGGYVPPFFVQRLEPVDLLREGLALINADNTVFALADVSLSFSPLYGKVALLGDGIIHFDGFLSAGLGATFDNGADLLHPTMNVGVGGRVFLTRWMVVRVDLRDYLYPQEKAGISTLQNLLFVGVGLGFYFPLDFDYQYEAARVNQNG